MAVVYKELVQCTRKSFNIQGNYSIYKGIIQYMGALLFGRRRSALPSGPSAMTGCPGASRARLRSDGQGLLRSRKKLRGVLQQAWMER